MVLGLNVVKVGYWGIQTDNWTMSWLFKVPLIIVKTVTVSSTQLTNRWGVYGRVHK
jgi:hypothetical protein